MNFEWDESKRLANIERHGLDFIDVILLFDGRPVVTLASPYAEDRAISFGGNARWAVRFGCVDLAKRCNPTDFGKECKKW